MGQLSPGTTQNSGGRYVPVVLIGAAVVVAVRLVLGPVIGNPAHPITFASILAGGVGAYLVIELSAGFDSAEVPWVQLWTAAIGPGDAVEYTWLGTWLQFLYFVVGASLYPWVFNRGLGLPGQTWAGLPTSLATGVLWSAAMFAVAALTYALTGTLALARANSREWALSAFLHLLYGVVFGGLIGVWYSILLI